jgi:anti-anti-sigma factor
LDIFTEEDSSPTLPLAYCMAVRTMTTSPVLHLTHQGIDIIAFAHDDAGWADVDQVRRYFANEFLPSTAKMTRLVIDLAGVASMDSACLGPLVQKLKETNELHGSLALCNVASPALREIFALTRFDKVFAIYATRAEALASLGT